MKPPPSFHFVRVVSCASLMAAASGLPEAGLAAPSAVAGGIPVSVALDKPAYAAGETAKLQISPRFAGEVLVTVGADRLLETFTATVPETGA